MLLASILSANMDVIIFAVAFSIFFVYSKGIEVGEVNFELDKYAGREYKQCYPYKNIGRRDSFCSEILKHKHVVFDEKRMKEIEDGMDFDMLLLNSYKHASADKMHNILRTSLELEALDNCKNVSSELLTFDQLPKVSGKEIYDCIQTAKWYICHETLPVCIYNATTSSWTVPQVCKSTCKQVYEHPLCEQLIHTLQYSYKKLKANCKAIFKKKLQLTEFNCERHTVDDGDGCLSQPITPKTHKRHDMKIYIFIAIGAGLLVIIVLIFVLARQYAGRKKTKFDELSDDYLINEVDIEVDHYDE